MAASKPLFQLRSPFPPAGDQPKAIADLVDGLHRGDAAQVLLGITGSGKTYTVAATSSPRVQRPALGA
jgi:excinuclease ABC subunit B